MFNHGKCTVKCKVSYQQKRDQNLALHGYIYRVNGRGPDTVFWRCNIPECSSTVSTENIPVGFGRQQHNHSADYTQIVAKQIINLVTEWCAKEAKPIPSIYSEELNKLWDNEWDKFHSSTVLFLLSMLIRNFILLLSSYMFVEI